MSLFGRDLICTQDWSKEDLLKVLKLAVWMKRERLNPLWNDSMSKKNFLMLFYSPSFRTHLSYITAATELGGHAQYMVPEMGRFKSNNNAGESIEDLAKVISGYMAGVGIRIMESAVSVYGQGNELIREYAHWADIPVINMADDKFHPCQSLADIMGWCEWLNNGLENINFNTLRNKKLLLIWGKGYLARSWNSPQGSLLLASRLGMNITIARPIGYDFNSEAYRVIEANCKINNSQFEIIDDPNSGYCGADVVYCRHWISPRAYRDGKFYREEEIEEALKRNNWITTKEKMLKTNNAIFTHPMPVDRGNEVEDEVASGPRSAIYTIANNRLHVQKAVMVLTMTHMGKDVNFLNRIRRYVDE